jgi:hypothetical protein
MVAVTCAERAPKTVREAAKAEGAVIQARRKASIRRLFPVASCVVLTLVAACETAATPYVPPFTFRLPPTTGPAITFAPPTADSAFCPLGMQNLPIGQAVVVQQDARDGQNRKIAAAGVFRVDEFIGSDADLQAADRLAYDAVRVLASATEEVRWVVLRYTDGVSYVYLARQVRADLALSDVLRDPLTPCLVPPEEATLVGYHALKYWWTGTSSSRWYRYDWNSVSGGTFSDASGLPGT